MKICEHASASEEIPERVGYGPLLVRFVCCHAQCRSCSVEYLRSRCSVAGAC
jgi:hypothetical protein